MGRGAEHLPKVEVVGSQDDAGIRSETAVTTARRRGGRVGGAVLLLALVAALAVAVVTSGGDGPTADGPDPEPVEGPSAAPIGETGDGAPSEAEVHLQDEPSPVFAGVDATVLLGSARDGWRTLELASGRVRPVDALEGVGPDDLRPVHDGVLVVGVDPTEVQHVALPGGATSRVALDLGTPELVRLADLVPAGPDRFWVTSWSFRPGGSLRWYATPVGAEGTATGEAVSIPDGTAIGATAHGLVYEAGGRTYLVGSDGARELGTGPPLATGVDHVATLSCEALTRCAVVHRDLTTPATATTDPVPVGAATRGRDGFTAAIGDDGALAFVPVRLGPLAWGSSGGVLSATLTVVRPGGAPAEVSVQSPKAGPAWLPGDGGVLVLTGRGLVRFEERDGRLVESVASGLRPRGDTTIFVIPG